MKTMLFATALAFAATAAANADPLNVESKVEQGESGTFQVNYSYLIQAANVASAIVNQTSGGDIRMKFEEEILVVEELAFNAATSVFGDVAVGEEGASLSWTTAD